MKQIIAVLIISGLNTRLSANSSSFKPDSLNDREVYSAVKAGQNFGEYKTRKTVPKYAVKPANPVLIRIVIEKKQGQMQQLYDRAANIKEEYWQEKEKAKTVSRAGILWFLFALFVAIKAPADIGAIVLLSGMAVLVYAWVLGKIAAKKMDKVRKIEEETSNLGYEIYNLEQKLNVSRETMEKI